MASSAQTSPANVVEQHTIDVVPDSERHGTPFSQFTLWMGANLQITAIVDGALAVAFGADPLWAIIGLLVGNIIGGIVMALHSAQGPRLGLPQMISSRAQFGVYGAVLPLVLVVLMYLGFASTGTYLAGSALSLAFGQHSPTLGIIVFGLTTFLIAALGYRYIHRYGKIATVLGIVTLGFLAVRLFLTYDVVATLGRQPFEMATFLLAVSLGAGWQLTFGPYVADYSRYLPRTTKESATFGWTFAGSVVGSQLAMSFGALLAGLPLPKADSFMTTQVGFLGKLAGGGVWAIVVYVVIALGKLTINTLNAYGGAMTMLTTVSAFSRKARFSQVARMAFIALFLLGSMVIAIAASQDFLNLFKNFILLLLTVFTPWSAINLVDYYLISKERVDIPALYDPDGRYGRWNPTALITYVVGIAVQIPFVSSTLYTGPLVDRLGGADISWLLGLGVPAAVYYVWGKRTYRGPRDAEQLAA